MADRAVHLTLPNLVSSSRFVLAVVFVVNSAVSVRVSVLVLAAVSDMLDGWLARRTNTTSRFGAMLDPVADRLFVLAVVTSYLVDGSLSIWQAVALLVRDVLSVIGFIVARTVSWLRAIPFRARVPGKIVTGLQFAAFLAVLVAPDLVTTLVVAACVLGLTAAADYTLMLWRERVPPELRGR